VDALRGAAVVGLIAVSLAGCAHHERLPLDPPTIVALESIGSARLGSTRTEIDHVYRTPVKIERLSHFFPPGTKYFGRVRVDATYRVRGGTLRVTYVDNRAKALETTSPRYRLADGIHVGTRVITRRCGKFGDCWRGYAYDDCTSLMIKLHGRVDSYLGFAASGVDYRVLMRHGYRIGSIGFGDPNALLLCF
jgi:hypothetical protein